MKKLARALIALAVLALVLGGLPWLFLRYGHWPITRLPDRAWLQHLGDRNVSDNTIMDILTVAAWLVWVAFAYSVILELAG